MISSTFKNVAIAGSVAAGFMALPAVANAHWNDHDGKTYDLANHHDFIMQIHLPGTTMRCCDGDDVFVNLKETPKPDGGYSVRIPAGTVLFRDAAGNPTKRLEQDTVIDVPPQRVLTDEQAYKVCKEMTKKGSTTCVPPEVNVLYIAPSNIGSNNQNLWCYWPVPKGF